MKVYDLVTGEKVELPSTGIQSGRYRLTQNCVLNGEVKLSRGTVLWRSGEGSASLTSEDQPDIRVPVRFTYSPLKSVSRSVVDLSIAAVVDGWSVDGNLRDLPSPILPSVLREHMEMMRPEPDLEQALASGQWDEVSVRPRLDMHYVPETLPVARAKRVQASAVEHLSQHSELWARRSISGVIPAKVLARVSEDDHAIYENIVFARLLDGCARWLDGRISEVRAIKDGQRIAMQLEKGDERHRLLTSRICALWGRAWFSEAEDSHATLDTLDRLERMRAHVERLRRSGVYTRIPRSARVPIALRPTNIFQYDKRYRELRPFWDALVNARAREKISESVRYEVLAARQAAFLRYVLLLILYALRDMGATEVGSSGRQHRVGPWDLEIDAERPGEVRIMIRSRGKLLQERALVLLLTKEDEVVCRDPNRSLFYAEDLMAGGSITDEDQDPRVLNPFKFFAVERVRQVLEHDFCRIFLAQYPSAADRVPAGIRDKLSGLAGFVFKPHGDRLLVLPSSNISVSKLYGWVSDACVSHPEADAQLRYAIGLGQWLVRCRSCGVNASEKDMSADELALRLVCPKCRLETTVKTLPARSMTSHYVGGRSGFEFCGGVEVKLPGISEE